MRLLDVPDHVGGVGHEALHLAALVAHHMVSSNRLLKEGPDLGLFLPVLWPRPSGQVLVILACLPSLAGLPSLLVGLSSLAILSSLAPYLLLPGLLQHRQERRLQGEGRPLGHKAGQLFRHTANDVVVLVQVENLFFRLLLTQEQTGAAARDSANPQVLVQLLRHLPEGLDLEGPGGADEAGQVGLGDAHLYSGWLLGDRRRAYLAVVHVVEEGPKLRVLDPRQEDDGVLAFFNRP